jgi:transcriptional regulator GlxA family with amidase domain
MSTDLDIEGHTSVVARTVALLAFDEVQILDVTGPAEVFDIANHMVGADVYRVVIVSSNGRDIVSSSGLRLGVELALDDLDGPIDTFIVPGTYAWMRAMVSDELLKAVTTGAERSRRVAAVCGGAFLLGAVGLLDGRRATTHWMFLDELAQHFPEAHVERDPIFVEDGPVFTSAGVTAGIDLALALVEADHGPAVARQIARYLVVFMQRPGGQAQFSVRMRAEPLGRSSLRDLLDSITENPAADHGLASLSERAGFSERHLTRLFIRELGMTPARYVENARLEVARTLLESADAPIEVIARRSGLRTVETLRRIFTREIGVSPHAYRQRFRTTGVTANTPATKRT